MISTKVDYFSQSHFSVRLERIERYPIGIKKKNRIVIPVVGLKSLCETDEDIYTEKFIITHRNGFQFQPCGPPAFCPFVFFLLQHTWFNSSAH